MSSKLTWFNSLPEAAAREALLNCCGAQKWCRQMLCSRPFENLDRMLADAERAADFLTVDDWKEAFAAHPKIGEKKAAGPEQAKRWSDQEQSAVAAASNSSHVLLQRLNEDYYSRFGYIFIVCATGKSADEILEILKQRIQNDPNTEIGIAANEQRKITRLRLQKLMAE